MKPLRHLTVLDLSAARSGAFASMIFAELGATVIKVEPPGADGTTRDAGFFACNRAKASIAVDLAADGGRRILRELARQADVLVESFADGAMGRQGLDYAALSSLNPRLVYVSCTAFGQSGPYAQGKGDVAVPLPRPGPADLAPGLWVAIAILAALGGRENSGRGAYVDFSIFDGQASLLALAMPDIAEVLADPQVRARKLAGSFDYPGAGEIGALALPCKFLGWDDPQIGRPPAPGEHTESVLRERLGYSDERIAELRRAQVIPAAG